MKIEKFLFEVFRTCLWEEEGSTEHITEHVTHEDVIEITKQLGLDDMAKKFKRISKCSEEGGDCDSTWDKLERILYSLPLYKQLWSNHTCHHRWILPFL